jgi:ABC-type glycerol-3-phosphate transport system permease component
MTPHGKTFFIGIAKVVTYALLIVACIVTLIPFLWMVCAAFKNKQDFFAYTFLPLGNGFLGIAWGQLTLENFVRIFTELDFSNSILNSLFLASTTAIISTITAAMGGYALSKFDFKGKNFIISIVIAAIIIPSALLIAPGYQLLYHLDLLDSYGGLLLPAIAPAFGVFLFRQAMLNSVPTSLLESARIDGCGEIRAFFVIVLPLVRPMIGAYLLITFLGTWNNFINPQIILQDADKFPLSVALAGLQTTYRSEYGMISAGTLISIAPVAFLFLLMQKEFITGLTSGALKG